MLDISGLEPIIVDDEDETEREFPRTNDNFSEQLPGPSEVRMSDEEKSSDLQRIIGRRSSMLQVVLTRIEDELSSRQ